MQPTAAVMPTFEIVQQLLTSSSQLVRGALAPSILAELSPAVRRWRSAYPQIEESIRPISSLIPHAASPEGDALFPDFSDTASREELARALKQTGANIATFSNAGERDLLEVMNRKLRTILQDSPFPQTSGIFSREGLRDRMLNEALERQIAQTLNALIAGVAHDSNNVLFAALNSLEEISELRREWFELADRNLQTAPGATAEGLRGTVEAHHEAMGRKLGSIRLGVEGIVSLVRDIQAVIHLCQNETDSAAPLGLLFADGGSIYRISENLLDLMSDIYDAGVELGFLNRIAQARGHRAPREDFARGTALRDAIAENLKTLQDCTAVLADLFRLLRAFQREPSLDSTEPADLRRYFSERLVHAVMGKSVSVLFRMDPSPWKIPGPLVHSWQVGLNLLVNARDAMARNGAYEKRLELSIRNVFLDAQGAAELQAAMIRPAPRQGSYVVLEVRDTGPGIPESLLPRIFDESVSGKGSTGLGLSVSLAIVRNMGGFIAVDTVREGDGRGTAFRIFFPRADFDLAPEPLLGSVPANETSHDLRNVSAVSGERASSVRDSRIGVSARPKPERGHEPILIVDDEPAVLKALRRQLESRGYQVLSAENGRQALAACETWYGRKENPGLGLVLMDVNMPGGMTGRELVGALREIDPGLTCVFHTGGLLPPDLSGVDRSLVIEKPSSLQEMLQAFRRILDGG